MKTEYKAVIASVVVIAIALAAVGGVTYSWFSDSDQADIDVSTGKVAIDFKITDSTAASGNMGSISHTDDDVTISLLSPNDSYEITYNINNDSTIDTIYRVYLSIDGVEIASMGDAKDFIYVGGTPLSSYTVSDGDAVVNVTDWTSLSAKTGVTGATLEIRADSAWTQEDNGAGWDGSFKMTLNVEAYQANYGTGLENGAAQVDGTTPINGSVDVSGGSDGQTVETQIIFDSEAASVANGDTLNVSATNGSTDVGFQLDTGTEAVTLSLSLDNGTTDFRNGAVTVTTTMSVASQPTDVNVVYPGNGSQPTDVSWTYDSTAGTITVTFTTSHFSDFIVIVGNEVTVSTGAALIAAMYAGMDVTISDDVTKTIQIDDSIVIPEGATSVLNLNGKAIQYNGTAQAVINHGTLTVNDIEDDSGSIITEDTQAQGRHVLFNYGTMTVNGGTFGDSTSRGNAVRNLGTMTVNGGNFTACDNYTNGGYAYAITNGGSESYDNAVLTINNANVYGHCNGLIGADAGQIEINDGTYNLAKFDGGGTYNVFHVFYAQYNSSITINGGEFYSDTTNTFFYPYSAAEDSGIDGNIIINGGEFSCPTSTSIQGGADPTPYLVQGKGVQRTVEDDLYVYTVVDATEVDTYDELIQNLKAGTPVILTANIVEPADRLESKITLDPNGVSRVDASTNYEQGHQGDLTLYAMLDFNGFTITCASDNGWGIQVCTGAYLTLRDSSGNNGGFVGTNTGDSALISVKFGGQIVIYGGSYVTQGVESDIYVCGDGNVTIFDGYFADGSLEDAYGELLNLYNSSVSGSITVYGGQYLNYDPSTGDDQKGGSFVASGYQVTSDTVEGGTLYTVVRS